LANFWYFSLEIRRRFWHPKNPRIRECPVKLRTQKIAKAIFVPQKCYAFLWALVRSRTLSADFYDILQMDFSDFRTLCKFIMSKFFLIFKSFDFVVT